jgi:hypothetical protein
MPKYKTDTEVQDMSRSRIHTVIAVISLVVLILACRVSAGEASDGAKTKCKMTFTLQGWSIIYETASGTGHITCSNGQSATVALKVTGGGLTAGKYKLRGKGEFSDVSGISELFGSYAAAEAHAGAVKSADAQVVTKGPVSLAITSKGSGFNLGVGFSSFKIERAGKKR